MQKRTTALSSRKPSTKKPSLSEAELIKKRRTELLRTKRRLEKILTKNTVIKKSAFSKAGSKFLAREALITLSFVERIRRQTKRPVVVIPLGKTGVPYTWGIEALKPRGVELAQMIKYPSSATFTAEYNARFDEIMNIFKRKNNPILIFVDSSMAPRMPSSFMGHPRNQTGYTSTNDSLRNRFEKVGFRVVLARYGFSKGMASYQFGIDATSPRPKVDKLPRNFDIRKNEKTVILLNPSRERTIKIDEQNWSSTRHDDATSGITPEFKEHTINQIKLFKK